MVIDDGCWGGLNGLFMGFKCENADGAVVGCCLVCCLSVLSRYAIP